MHFSPETTSSRETIGIDKHSILSRHVNDSKWYYKNDPFRKEPLLSNALVLDEAELDALLGWHIYESLPMNSGEQYEPNVFQQYIAVNSQEFMKHASLLQRQFPDISELLKYVGPRSPNTPMPYVEQSLCHPNGKNKSMKLLTL